MQRTLILTGFILTFVAAVAQQKPVFTQYQLNGYLLNPAKAGAGDNLNIFMLYRNQWTGMPGAPETTVITADGALKNKKIGLGLVLARTRPILSGKQVAWVHLAISLAYLQGIACRLAYPWALPVTKYTSTA